MLGWLLGGLTTVTALGVLAGRNEKAFAAGTTLFTPTPKLPPAYTVVALNALMNVMLAIAQRRPVSDAERAMAASDAEKFGLPKTAKAIRSESGLPTDELWPGTQLSVLDAFKARLAQVQGQA